MDFYQWTNFECVLFFVAQTLSLRWNLCLVHEGICRDWGQKFATGPRIDNEQNKSTILALSL